MKIKTSELEVAALDWAVASVLSYEFNDHWFKPSADWIQGGPLIQRYNVELFIQPTAKGRYGAGIPEVCRFASDSYLVSAMRAIVASELGDEVDVPEEIL